MLKIDKHGKNRIVITDTEDESVIYDGTPDVDCVIEAMSFYMGEETEVEEHEAMQAVDPLKHYGTDSLSTDKDEVEFEELPDELEDVDDYCEGVIPKSIEIVGGTRENREDDWPNDDE